MVAMGISQHNTQGTKWKIFEDFNY